MLPFPFFLASAALLDAFTTWLGEALWNTLARLGPLIQGLADVDRQYLIPLGIASVVVVGLPVQLMRGWFRSAKKINTDYRSAKAKLAEAKLDLVIGDRQRGLGLLMVPLVLLGLYFLGQLIFEGYHSQPDEFWHEGY